MKSFILTLIASLSVSSFAQTEITCMTTGESLGVPTQVTVTITIDESSYGPAPTSIVAIGDGVTSFQGLSEVSNLTNGHVIVNFENENQQIELVFEATASSEGLTLSGHGVASITPNGRFKPEYVLSNCLGVL